MKKQVNLYPTDEFSNGYGIEQGDILRARITSVEGRRKVILEVVGKTCPRCLNGLQRDIITGYDGDGNEITQDVSCDHCRETGVLMN